MERDGQAELTCVTGNMPWWFRPRRSPIQVLTGPGVDVNKLLVYSATHYVAVYLALARRERRYWIEPNLAKLT